MNKEDLVKKARARAEEKAGFFTHLAIYLAINTLLLVINLASNNRQGDTNLWFIWSAVGWGIGLVIHFISVFVGADLMERYISNQTQKELDKLTDNK